MVKRITLLIVAAVLAVGAAMAQDPIRWRTTVKMTNDTEGVLTVRALVADGWHLYGTSLPKGGPKPTAISLATSTGIKFIDKAFTASVAPVTEFDATFNMKLTYWRTNVTFTRRFRLTGPRDKAFINGTITFMGCNGENCLRPSTITVNKLRIK